MYLNNNADNFLTLVRMGIGKDYSHSWEKNAHFSSSDWMAIQKLANEQGLTAVVLDGIDKSEELAATLPVAMKLDWIGQVLQNYEQRYDSYKNAHAEMAKFYSEHGYKMMVLKGYACSLDWPKPEHRPCGDIDIWQFGEQQAADALLTKEKGIKIDSSHHHHTVFEWNGFSVENHYDFINVHHHKSNVEFEAILKELGNLKVESSEFRAESQLKECSDAGCKIPTVEVNGEKVYIPSPNLHALFLMKHITMHFAAEGITLRQLLDWAFFVEKHGYEVDWEYVDGVLEQFGMKNMFNIINAICVGDFGFPVKMFPAVQFDPNLKEKVMAEILSPEYSVELPKGLFRRIVFKLRRWKANAWKHELCYKESMWSAFWSGVWNHLLKPSSI